MSGTSSTTSRSGMLRECSPIRSCSSPFRKTAASGNCTAAGSQPRASAFSFKISSATGVSSPLAESTNCHRCSVSSASSGTGARANVTPADAELPPNNWAASCSFPKKTLPRPTSPEPPSGSPWATKLAKGFLASARSRITCAISSSVPLPVMPHRRKRGSRWVLLLWSKTISSLCGPGVPNDFSAEKTAHIGSSPLKYIVQSISSSTSAAALP